MILKKLFNLPITLIVAALILLQPKQAYPWFWLTTAAPTTAVPVANTTVANTTTASAPTADANATTPVIPPTPAPAAQATPATTQPTPIADCPALGKGGGALWGKMTEELGQPTLPETSRSWNTLFTKKTGLEKKRHELGTKIVSLQEQWSTLMTKLTNAKATQSSACVSEKPFQSGCLANVDKQPAVVAIQHEIDTVNVQISTLQHQDRVLSLVPQYDLAKEDAAKYAHVHQDTLCALPGASTSPAAMADKRAFTALLAAHDQHRDALGKAEALANPTEAGVDVCTRHATEGCLDRETSTFIQTKLSDEQPSNLFDQTSKFFNDTQTHGKALWEAHPTAAPIVAITAAVCLTATIFCLIKYRTNIKNGFMKIMPVIVGSVLTFVWQNWNKVISLGSEQSGALYNFLAQHLTPLLEKAGTGLSQVSHLVPAGARSFFSTVGNGLYSAGSLISSIASPAIRSCIGYLFATGEWLSIGLAPTGNLLAWLTQYMANHPQITMSSLLALVITYKIRKHIKKNRATTAARSAAQRAVAANQTVASLAAGAAAGAITTAIAAGGAPGAARA